MGKDTKFVIQFFHATTTAGSRYAPPAQGWALKGERANQEFDQGELLVKKTKDTEYIQSYDPQGTEAQEKGVRRAAAKADWDAAKAKADKAGIEFLQAKLRREQEQAPVRTRLRSPSGWDQESLGIISETNAGDSVPEIPEGEPGSLSDALQVYRRRLSHARHLLQRLFD